MQELHAALGRARVGGLDLVDADELLVLTVREIDGLEDLGDDHLMLGLLQQALEGPRRRRVGGVAIEDVAVDLDGRVRRVHARLAQLRELQHQLDLAIRVVRHGQLTVHVVRELGPHLLAREEAVERGERVRAGRVDLQDLAVQRDGRVGLREVLVVDERHLREQLLLLGPIGGDGDAAAKHAHQVAPALRTAVEVLERLEHFEVGRVEVQHLAVRPHGAVHVAELRVVDLRSLDPQRARQVGVLHATCQLADELHQRREVLLLDGHGLEPRQRARVRGDLAQGFGRRRRRPSAGSRSGTA
jgi:hypothetical protein